MLYFSIHIDDQSQWGSCIYAINAVKRLLPTQNLGQLYFSLILSYMYGLLLWGLLLNIYLKINKIQNKVIINIRYRYVVYNADISTIYNKLNIPKVDCLKYKITSSYTYSLIMLIVCYLNLL